MYRKYRGKDEIFSNVILSFVLLLLNMFLLYPRVIENNIYDLDTYLFFTLGGFSLIYFLISIIRTILLANRQIIDFEIDIESEEIKINDGNTIYSFTEVILFGRNVEKKQTRIYVNKKQLGFHDATLRDKDDTEIPSELVDKIGEHAIVVNHRELYNYNLLSAILIITAFIVFAFYIKQFTLFTITINSIIVFGFTVLIYIIIILINRLRMHRLVKKNTKANS